MKVVHSRN